MFAPTSVGGGRGFLFGETMLKHTKGPWLWSDDVEPEVGWNDFKQYPESSIMAGELVGESTCLRDNADTMCGIPFLAGTNTSTVLWCTKFDDDKVCIYIKNIADARLIAASPDLFDALKIFMEAKSKEQFDLARKNAEKIISKVEVE